MLAVLEGCIKGQRLLSPANFARVPCCIQYESVRNYPRKPRWLPQIAKSKMYKVLVTHFQPKLENEETVHIYNNYQLYSRSLWAFERNLFQERELQMQHEAQQVSEEVELERIFKLNDATNERIRNIRDGALIEENEQERQAILQKKQRMEEKELQRLEETEKELLKTMERLKGAIPKEQLDEAIEKALAIEIDYNYGITPRGNVLIGRENATEIVEGPPPPPDKPLIKASSVRSVAS